MNSKATIIFSVVILFLLGSAVYSVDIPQKYKEAMDAYNRNDFNTAIELFGSFPKQYGIDDEFSATAYYYLGISLLKTGETGAAISALEFYTDKYIWSNFRDEALYKLGTLYFGQENFSSSRERLQTLLDDYPQSEFTGPSLYFVGESFSAEEEYEKAIEYLKGSIATKKNNVYVDHSIYSLAYVYEKLYKYKDAVSYYDTLLAYYKSSSLAADAQVRIGICYFKLKQYDNAVIELSDPLVDELPLKQYSEAKFILGHSFYKLKEYSDAETTFNKVIKKNPEQSLLREAKYGLAWTLFQQQKYDQAFNTFNSLSKSGNDTIEVNSFFWSAECKRYDNKENEANKIYQDFLQKYPHSKLVPQVQLQLGITNLDGKYKASEDNLIAALNSDNKSVRAKAHTLLGELKLNQKNYKVAKANFEDAINLGNLPTELENRALLGLAISLYYNDDYDNAIKKLRQLQSNSPKFESNKVSFYLAESYFVKKDYKNALKQYNKVDPDDKELNAQLLYGKGYSYFNLRDYNNASYNFLDYVRHYQKDNNFADARMRLADCYYGLKKYSEAGKVYKEIFVSGNAKLNDDYAHYQYAQALYKSGNSNDAIQEFNLLQTQFPNSKYVAESQYVIGWIHFQKGQFHEAIKNYRTLIVRYPRSPLVPVAYNSIGNSYYNLGKYDSANVFYGKVIDDYTSSNSVFDAINGIKDSYIAWGKPDQAITQIDAYISGNPRASFTDQLYFKKGEIYYSLGNYEKARQIYRDFISGYSGSPLVYDAYYWIGKSSANLKQNEEAISSFNKVIASNINTEIGISAVLEVGKIYTDNKNYDAAINVYGKAVDKLSPESPKVAEITYNKAMAYIAKGDVSKAYEDFNYLIQYHDETIFAANSKFEIALIELARKNYETSDVVLRELSENRNDDVGAKAQYYYGQSLFEQNKIDEAISALVRVRFAFAAYDEWLTKSYLKLGECYEKKSDNQKARELYRTVLTRHQNDDYGKQAQKKLRSLK